MPGGTPKATASTSPSRIHDPIERVTKSIKDAGLGALQVAT
jgi:hypothetical protein